jgi:Heterokaryon incompatibility protein (HET)
MDRAVDEILDNGTENPDAVFELLEAIVRPQAVEGPPNQDNIILDGTAYMIQKSRSFEFATKLQAPLPSPGVSQSPQPLPALQFNECRKCAGRFSYSLESGTVSIVAGIPKEGLGPYKAMSYVWGATSTLDIPCANCGHVTSVPMLSPQRFVNLMNLGGAGNTIWLDAVSINQSDPADIAASVKVMGTIYSSAACVSVLLPDSDQPAFDCLDMIAKLAMGILLNIENFMRNRELTARESPEGIQVESSTTDDEASAEVSATAEGQREHCHLLSSFSKLYLKNLENLRTHLASFTYWQRAWTFQEWALANDLEIAIEGGSAVTLFGVKSLVLGASMLLARYKMLYGQYATINIGETRGMAPVVFKLIKYQFPDEHLFLSYEEIDDKEATFQTHYPHLGLNQVLGVRSLPRPPWEPQPDEASRLRARLLLLLPTFAIMPRTAKYEADLVASWASMCNIDYEYDREDTFEAALSKVIAVLRSRGITIYEFMPNTTGGSLSRYTSFREYAHEQLQRHTTNFAPTQGPPIFTGIADIFTHVLYSVLKVELPTRWNGVDEGLQPLGGASIVKVIRLDDAEQASEEMSHVFYGHSLPDLNPSEGYFMFYPAKQIVAAALKSEMVGECRRDARLCIVRIPFRKDQEPLRRGLNLYAWAILPADVEDRQLRVCREPVNGTLVLATTEREATHIVAYLTLTDLVSGTFLINVDEAFHLSMILRIPMRADMGHSRYLEIGDRFIRGTVLAGTDI